MLAASNSFILRSILL